MSKSKKFHSLLHELNERLKSAKKPHFYISVAVGKMFLNELKLNFRHICQMCRKYNFSSFKNIFPTVTDMPKIGFLADFNLSFSSWRNEWNFWICSFSKDATKSSLPNFDYVVHIWRVKFWDTSNGSRKQKSAKKHRFSVIAHLVRVKNQICSLPLRRIPM